ncbi:MAG: class II aldolase/adducin family protein [Spirochaetales bacterium]|uniref:Class II aldolase/adducin family protein n=1 Tax=Candidatus Thalassospirochaeta sargassi TaxID=3119039 RepID=A0AAJ1IGV3_9SPIO|nr:class II aldolase/adducin family protein [Spirochaetales bacterium]
MKDKIKESYRQLIVDTGIEMLDKGITVGTWGNISARDPETDLVYISPSGMDYLSIKAKHVVVMDLNLNVIDGETEPSIEKHMHIAVFNTRKDVNAVVHTHPVYSSAFGTVEQPLPGISEDFIQIVGAEVQVARPYALPGTAELGETAVAGLGDNNAVLLPGHGALLVGTDMKMALKVSLVLEKNAQIYLYAKMLGGDIRAFKQNEIDFMQDFARNSYGKKNKGA